MDDQLQWYDRIVSRTGEGSFMNPAIADLLDRERLSQLQDYQKREGRGGAIKRQRKSPLNLEALQKRRGLGPRRRRLRKTLKAPINVSPVLFMMRLQGRGLSKSSPSIVLGTSSRIINPAKKAILKKPIL